MLLTNHDNYILHTCSLLEKTKHAINGAQKGFSVLRKEENILFNDTFNTCYLLLYGIRHIVKEDSNNERGNPLP